MTDQVRLGWATAKVEDTEMTDRFRSCQGADENEDADPGRERSADKECLNETGGVTPACSANKLRCEG